MRRATVVIAGIALIMSLGLGALLGERAGGGRPTSRPSPLTAATPISQGPSMNSVASPSAPVQLTPRTSPAPVI